MSGGHCATESREVASRPRTWRAECPGGHVGQPDVSSAVPALAGDEQRVKQLVVVVFDLFRHWCPRSSQTRSAPWGSSRHGNTGRRWPRRGPGFLDPARPAEVASPGNGSCWLPGQPVPATITRKSSRPTTAAVDSPIPSADTSSGGFRAHPGAEGEPPTRLRLGDQHRVGPAAFRQPWQERGGAGLPDDDGIVAMRSVRR